MKTKLCWSLALAMATLIATASAGPSADATKQGRATWREGAAFLMQAQNWDGSWSRARMPGITALCVIALHKAPGDADARDAAIRKGLESILAFAREDGAIAPQAGNGGRGRRQALYATYNTALSLLALATLKRPEDADVMRRARQWLKAQQINARDAVSYGGFGYGSQGGHGQGRADLSNTTLATEAMYYTEYLDREPFAPKGQEMKLAAENKQMWQALDRFLDTCHNRTKKGDSDSARQLRNGAFSYIPGKLMTTTSMTYAGLQSMLYAKLERDDPRVRITWQFVQSNFSVDDNPGQGMKGYYSYMHNLTRALDAYGQDTVKTQKGKTVNWRNDAIHKLAELQNDNGSWKNAEGRFMESLPELASAYAMIGLKHALGLADLALE